MDSFKTALKTFLFTADIYSPFLILMLLYALYERCVQRPWIGWRVMAS